MILYERSRAPNEIKLRFHIRDKFGKDIIHSLDYNTDTGVGHCYVPNSDAIIEYFKPGGYVEVDGHVNPSEQALQAIYSNTSATLHPEVMNAVVKKVEQDVGVNEQTSER